MRGITLVRIAGIQQADRLPQREGGIKKWGFVTWSLRCPSS